MDVEKERIDGKYGKFRGLLGNTLLWQAAYSEFVFLEECWTRITPDLVLAAIAEYKTRERRFGGLKMKAAR